MRSIAFSALLAALLATPALAQAQTTVAVYRGASEYDLSGVDRAPTTSVRVLRNLSSILVVEGSASFVEFTPELGSRTRLYMPEALLQLQLPLGRSATYLGAGVGVAFEAPVDEQLSTDTSPTFLAAAGFRMDLPYHLMVGVDGRIRGFETNFAGSGSEISLGIGYRF